MADRLEQLLQSLAVAQRRRLLRGRLLSVALAVGFLALAVMATGWVSALMGLTGVGLVVLTVATAVGQGVAHTMFADDARAPVVAAAVELHARTGVLELHRENGFVSIVGFWVRELPRVREAAAADRLVLVEDKAGHEALQHRSGRNRQLAEAERLLSEVVELQVRNDLQAALREIRKVDPEGRHGAFKGALAHLEVTLLANRSAVDRDAPGIFAEELRGELTRLNALLVPLR